MNSPSGEPTGTGPPGAQPDSDLRRLLLVFTVLALPVVLLVGGGIVLWSSFTTETFGPLAAGHGWIAFERQVEHPFPADRDRSVWLGRTIDDRDSWHLLAPTDTARVRRFTWISPTLLRIQVAAPDGEIGDDWVREVDGISIEWSR